MNRRLRPIVALALAVTAAFVLAGPASAHSALAGVDPVEGSVVAEGTLVTLSFNEELLEVGTEIVVTDAEGVATPLAAARPLPSQVSVTLPALAEGAVTLAWRVVSADGHPIEGVLAYVAEAPTLPPPSASGSASAVPSFTASALPEPTPSEGADAEQGFPVALWIAIAAAIAAAGAVSIATKRRG